MKLTIRGKVMAFAAAVSFGSAALLGGFFRYSGHRLVYERLEEKGRALAQEFSENVSASIRRGEPRREVPDLLASLSRAQDLSWAAVYDPSGKFIEGTGAAPRDADPALPALRGEKLEWKKASSGPYYVLAVPIAAAPGDGAGPAAGWVKLSLSSKGALEKLASLRLAAVAVVLLFLTIVIALAALFTQWVLRPLDRILAADAAVMRGDWKRAEIPEAQFPSDEFGRIMRSRANMVSALRQSEEMYRALAETQRGKAAELKRAFEDLQRLREQLTQSEKLAVMGQVVAGVAHELNNPLTGIMGYSQLLLKELPKEADSRLREDLDRIFIEAERCQKIVLNLTSFARKHKPEKEPVDLNRLLDDCLRLEAYHLKTRNIEVGRDFEPSLPETMADSHQLQQVFLNLFVNAEQAMTAHEKSGTLRVRTRLVGASIRVEVEDSGPGIPPEALPKLFDPFFTTKPVGEGTGLGLSLSYGIVEEHGGRIEAKNLAGGGAVFIVDLPVTAVAAKPKAPIHALTPLPPGRRVLVVDDEGVIRELLARVLKKLGQSPDLAEDGRAALEKLEANDYDLICCDIRMPNLDGMELFRWVRQAKPHLVSRWIFITGSVSDATQNFLDASGRPQLHKPFDLTLLRLTLEKVLNAQTQA